MQTALFYPLFPRSIPFQQYSHKFINNFSLQRVIHIFHRLFHISKSIVPQYFPEFSSIFVKSAKCILPSFKNRNSVNINTDFSRQVSINPLFAGAFYFLHKKASRSSYFPAAAFCTHKVRLRHDRFEARHSAAF